MPNITISAMIKRDTNIDVIDNNQQKKYQISSLENSNKIKISKVDKTKDICIYEHIIGNIKCHLVSYILSDADIETKNFLMVGYIIKNINILGVIDLIFVPENDIIQQEMNGKFQIIMTNSEKKKKYCASSIISLAMIKLYI